MAKPERTLCIVGGVFIRCVPGTDYAGLPRGGVVPLHKVPDGDPITAIWTAIPVAQPAYEPSTILALQPEEAA